MLYSCKSSPTDLYTCSAQREFTVNDSVPLWSKHTGQTRSKVNLIDKAFNLRETQINSMHTHKQAPTFSCRATLNSTKRDLAWSVKLTLIAREDLFHLTFWFGSQSPAGILTFYYKNPMCQISHWTRRRQQSGNTDFSSGWLSSCILYFPVWWLQKKNVLMRWKELWDTC